MPNNDTMNLMEVLTMACAASGLSRSYAEIKTISEEAELQHSDAGVLETSGQLLGMNMEPIKEVTELDVGRDAIVSYGEGRYAYLQVGAQHRDPVRLFLSPGNPPESLSKEEFFAGPERQIYQLSVLADKFTLGKDAVPSIRQWMRRVLWVEKGMLIKIIVASLLANILAVGISLYSLQIYDRVLPNQSYETLAVLTIGVLIAIVVEGSIRIVRSLVVDRLGLAIERSTSPNLMQAILSARLSDRKASPSNIVNLTRELNSIRELFTATATSVIADIPFVFIFVLLIYFIGGSVAYVILAAASTIILFGLITRPFIAKLSEDLLRSNSDGARVVNEAAYNIETVKAVSGELLFIRRWREVLDFNLNRTSKFRAVMGAVTTIAASIQQIAYVAVMAFASLKVFEGEFTAGTMIAMSILTSRTLAPVTQFSNAINRWEQMKAAIRGIDVLLAATPERHPGKKYIKHNSFSGGIELRNVAFHYPGSEAPQFKCEHFTIKAGEKIVLLGRNGSGKSALLRALSGLYDFEAGQLFYDGLEVGAIDPDDRARSIALMAQENRLFLGTIRENLCMGETSWSDDELIRALQFAGIEELIGDGGLDRMLQDGGEGLSGGQKQAVALARLHLRNPKIVLFDEPTAALDQTAEGALVSRLKEWMHDRTVIIATHRLPLLDLATRVVVLNNGTVLLDGPKDDVLAKLRS